MVKISHPSPDKIRKKWVNLNGEWDFSFDEPVFDRKINVPFSWVSPLSGINDEEKKGTGYYRKHIKYSHEKRLFIIFDGVDYECEVFLNGEKLKEHKGGYCRIEVEVTNSWKKDAENEIVVKATDNDCEDQMYGKQGYGNIRGIWQSVWLEERPESYIEKFRVVTKINGEISYDLTVAGEFSKVEADIDGDVFCSNESTVNFKIENPKLWSPEEPNLYYCTLRLYSESGVDEVDTYFGIRETGTKKIDGKTYITLNNNPIYVNAALDQSFNAKGHFTFPYDDYNREEIVRAKELGLNALRVHIKTEEKLKLYWADKLGMLIIEDIPCFWGEPTDNAKENFEREMYEIIDRDINHPSVFYWVIFNETWGLKHFNPENKSKWEFRKETQDWVRRLYHEVKEYDPTRLVEDNSPCNRDHIESDVNSWHMYINGYENMKKHCDEVSETFVEGSSANYTEGNVMTDIPVMNSECGNYWGIVGNAGDSDISWQYKYMMNEFRLHDRICGFVFTELKDVTNEFNGYYRLDDSKKYFGYENYVEDMSVKDLHSKDYLGFDYPPMTTVKAKEEICIPLFVSSFTSDNHGKNMKIYWETELETAIEERQKTDSGCFNISYNAFGTTFFENLRLIAPEKNGIFILKLYLKDEDDNIVMRNFVLFDVQENIENSLTVDFKNFKTDSFKRVWEVQQGNKLNCVGEGVVSVEIDKSEIGDFEEYIEILFEASSKEELTKDRLDIDDGEYKIDLDLMRGYIVDRGKNPNSFYMTDDEIYESNIEVSAENVVLAGIKLEDDPADTTGCLSWHYQAVDNKLDEAGSYGYLCRVKIDKELYNTLPEKFSFNIKADNGLSVFGRKSGRYPIGFEVISK